VALCYAVHELSDQGPRPWPLTVFFQACFINVDNHDPGRISDARPEPLFEVEDAQAGFAHDPEIETAQQHRKQYHTQR